MESQNLSISSLQFADDTIFFRDASMWNIMTLKSILQCFEMASGLKVNFYKSSIIGINVKRRTIQTFADTLNCKMMDCKFYYLGLRVRANPRSLATWQPVLRKSRSVFLLGVRDRSLLEVDYA